VPTAAAVDGRSAEGRHPLPADYLIIRVGGLAASSRARLQSSHRAYNLGFWLRGRRALAAVGEIGIDSPHHARVQLTRGFRDAVRGLVYRSPTILKQRRVRLDVDS